MSTNRIDPRAGFVIERQLPRGPNGRPLCRRCSAEVPRGRRTFCSSECVHEWKLRTQPQYVRSCLFDLERGVCRACGLDTEAMRNRLKAMVWKERPRKRPGVPGYREGRRYFDMDEFHALYSRAKHFGLNYSALKGVLYSGNMVAGGLWAADHIIEVADGGGECGLDNYQTLCWNCHRLKTNESRGRRKGNDRK